MGCHQVYDQQLTSTLTDVAEDKKLDADMKLAVALLALHPQLPLTWKGEVVSPEWLPDHVPTATAILCSTILSGWRNCEVIGDCWSFGNGATQCSRG